MVSDVTEFQVAGQKVYLSPLIDLFNGEVVGRSVSMSPTVNFVNKMFEGVTDRVPLWIRPTVHTDQGLQYWHKTYKEQLMKIKALQSMSRK
ncbi:MAG: DDE-type integrase/transposase/recombinase, partial [Raoultibacter sp.]